MGEISVLFYETFFKINENKEKACNRYKIINVKGIGNYGSKAPAKFEYEIKSKFPKFTFIVFCSYDTDVFEFGQKPPVNWKQVEKALKKKGAKEIYHIKAKKMIEDWFLIDKEGLCRFLKIKQIPKKLKGKDGNAKMKTLFKKANKIYQKGSYTHKFMDSLSLQKIFNAQKKELEILEKKLFNIKEKN